MSERYRRHQSLAHGYARSQINIESNVEVSDFFARSSQCWKDKFNLIATQLYNAYLTEKWKMQEVNQRHLLAARKQWQKFPKSGDKWPIKGEEFGQAANTCLCMWGGGCRPT